MEWVAIALDFSLGAVIAPLATFSTSAGKPINICCGCEAKFGYSLAEMSPERHDCTSGAVLREVHTLRGAE